MSKKKKKKILDAMMTVVSVLIMVAKASNGTGNPS